jgi:hypothetical protein
MRTLLRTLGAIVLGVAVILGALLLGARFHDGPLAIVAGGPFTSGESYVGPEPDWSFVRELATIEFQSLEPARSRTTWVVEHEGRVFIPCGYMNSWWGRIWKKWPLEAERDGRVILRIDGKLYERALVRRLDGEALAPVLDKLARKYFGASGPTPGAAAQVNSGSLWIFEVVPRS